LLVGRRFLERVQVLSVNVLQQCVPQKLVVLGGANDGWNALEPRRPGRPDPPLTHHDLVAVATRTNHDRLQHTTASMLVVRSCSDPSSNASRGWRGLRSMRLSGSCSNEGPDGSSEACAAAGSWPLPEARPRDRLAGCLGSALPVHGRDHHGVASAGSFSGGREQTASLREFKGQVTVGDAPA
jgi:hypothetical protein